MMKEYILTLMTAAILVTVTSIILPEGNVKKYATLASSVVISLSVIAPLKGVLGIEGDFLYGEEGEYELTTEEAEKLYIENLTKSLAEKTEEKLSEYGRAYVVVSDNLKVKSIEIYAERNLSEEEIKEIEKLYEPERLEVIYGEH